MLPVVFDLEAVGANFNGIRGVDWDESGEDRYLDPEGDHLLSIHGWESWIFERGLQDEFFDGFPEWVTGGHSTDTTAQSVIRANTKGDESSEAPLEGFTGWGEWGSCFLGDLLFEDGPGAEEQLVTKRRGKGWM
jgi:hypothetical protein